MKVYVVSMSAILMSIALVSEAMAGPDGKQGQQQVQSVTGTISVIGAKQQTITVTPFSDEQSQAQQSQPKGGQKGLAATSYVFCVDARTQILGDLAKKGDPGKLKGEASPSLTKKDQGQERRVTVVAKEGQGQGTAAGAGVDNPRPQPTS